MVDWTWILAGGLAMNAIALVGGVATLLRPAVLDRLLLPMVALAAGSLLGGALFHVMPVAAGRVPPLAAGAWVAAGFVTFLALEQFLHWHHCHRSNSGCRRPMTYLILAGDTVHNFLGGMAVASAFALDPRIGLTSWLAAAAHEIPQEVGDFGVLVHGGWDRRRALCWNVLSGATFPAGALLAHAASLEWDTSALALFGAGNFVYIAASDLVPEIKAHPSAAAAAAHFGCFAGSLAMMFGLAVWLG
jgi:zinc and cadmium transporter